MFPFANESIFQSFAAFTRLLCYCCYRFVITAAFTWLLCIRHTSNQIPHRTLSPFVCLISVLRSRSLLHTNLYYHALVTQPNPKQIVCCAPGSFQWKTTTVTCLVFLPTLLLSLCSCDTNSTLFSFKRIRISLTTTSLRASRIRVSLCLVFFFLTGS